MALVNIISVKLLNNPTKFTNPFDFQITFECCAPGIKGELDWKLIYVGSAGDSKHDQQLDCVSVGPVAIGKSEFVFEAPPPDHSRIPKKDLTDVTAVLLTCSYQEREFVRIGYYVNIDYGDNKELTENPPETPVIEKLVRNVMQDKPLVTRFQIPWNDDAQALQRQQFMEHQEHELLVAEQELLEEAEFKRPEVETTSSSVTPLSSSILPTGSNDNKLLDGKQPSEDKQSSSDGKQSSDKQQANDDNENVVGDEDDEGDVEIDLEDVDEEEDDEELDADGADADSDLRVDVKVGTTVKSDTSQALDGKLEPAMTAVVDSDAMSDDLR